MYYHIWPLCMDTDSSFENPPKPTVAICIGCLCRKVSMSTPDSDNIWIKCTGNKCLFKIKNNNIEFNNLFLDIDAAAHTHIHTN